MCSQNLSKNSLLRHSFEFLRNWHIDNVPFDGSAVSLVQSGPIPPLLTLPGTETLVHARPSALAQAPAGPTSSPRSSSPETEALVHGRSLRPTVRCWIPLRNTNSGTLHQLLSNLWHGNIDSVFHCSPIGRTRRRKTALAHRRFALRHAEQSAPAAFDHAASAFVLPLQLTSHLTSRSFPLASNTVTAREMRRQHHIPSLRTIYIQGRQKPNKHSPRRQRLHTCLQHA